MEKEFATSSSEKTGFNKASSSSNQDVSSGNGSRGETSSRNSGNSDGGGSPISGEGVGRKSYSKSLCYPTTLRRTQQDTLRISVLKYEPKKMEGLGFKSRTSAKGRTIGAVTLPIPGGVNDKNQTAWGTGTMTPVQIATSNAVNITSVPLAGRIEAAPPLPAVACHISPTAILNLLIYCH